MLELALRVALALVLLFAAGSKLVAPRSSEAALASFGLPPGRVRGAVWVALIIAEIGLALAVVSGADAAAFAAAGLMLVFALGLLVAIARGKGGAPCACFGSRSRIGWPAVLRNGVLAAAFVGLALLPDEQPTGEQWLAAGLVVALLACAGLTVAVLALAREVGALRLELAPQGALEIPGEGPELGTRSSLIERFEIEPRSELALAVFTSPGCHLCHTLGPAIADFGAHPALTLALFDEERDIDVWRELGVPGSPYAVALGLEGVVLAKGAFNTLGQLESVAATAERRAEEAGLHA